MDGKLSLSRLYVSPGRKADVILSLLSMDEARWVTREILRAAFEEVPSVAYLNRWVNSYRYDDRPGGAMPAAAFAHAAALVAEKGW